jgi:hypothetical protein
MARITTGSTSVPGGTIVEAGALSGVIGGIAMVIFLMGVSALTSHDLLAPARVMGLAFEPTNARLAGVGATVWGLSLHLSWAAILGIFFARLIGREPLAISVGSGIVFGLVVFVGMTYLVLPWANQPMYAAVHRMMPAWVASHVIFGACLGFAGPLNARWESHGEWW